MAADFGSGGRDPLAGAPVGGFFDGIRLHRGLRRWGLMAAAVIAVMFLLPVLTIEPSMLREERILKYLIVIVVVALWLAAAIDVGIRNASRFYTLSNFYAYTGQQGLSLVSGLLTYYSFGLEKELHYYAFQPGTTFRIETSRRYGRKVQQLYVTDCTDQSGQVYKDEICVFANLRPDPVLSRALEQILPQRQNQDR